jgi:hypothetical protein
VRADPASAEQRGVSSAQRDDMNDLDNSAAARRTK